MYEKHYFEKASAYYETFTTDDLVTPGDRVYDWYPSSSFRVNRFDSISECITQLLKKPFSSDPIDWQYVGDGWIETSVLSTEICKNFIEFAKVPTKSQIKEWERGERDLYIVKFTIQVYEISEQSASEESAADEGIYIHNRKRG